MTIQLARQPATTANTGGELDSTSTAILPVAKLNVTTQLSETVTTNTSTGTLSDLAWTTGIIRFTTPGAVTLNGVVAPTDGVFLTIVNDGSNLITIPYNTGTAANSFVNNSTRSITIAGNDSATFRYSGGRWRLISANYQEGTWTPSLTGTGGATNFSSVGYFTRTGNLLHYRGAVSFDKGTLSGTIKINGLPFTSSTLGFHYPGSIALVANQTPPATASAHQQLMMYQETGTTNLVLQWRTDGGAAVVWDASHMAASGNVVHFSGTYQII